MRLLACALVSVLAYLPWMPSFINQLKSVSESYWIPPLTFRSIFGCLKYIFLPTSYDTTRNYILAVIMIVLVTVTFFYGVWSGLKGKEYSKKISPYLWLLYSGIYSIYGICFFCAESTDFYLPLSDTRTWGYVAFCCVWINKL